jgi:hypothetical protein
MLTVLSPASRERHLLIMQRMDSIRLIAWDILWEVKTKRGGSFS